MRSLRNPSAVAPRARSGTQSILAGASVAAACLASAAYAQDAGTTESGAILLPTVDVETTEAPAQPAAPRRTQTRSRQASTTPPAPQECTPEFAGTPVCAEEEAAERAAAQAARAEAKARAGSNPNADPDAQFKADRLTNSRVQGELLDTPRTVTAVTQEVIETTNTTSIRQLARTTPGVSLGFGEGGNSYGDNIYIRGFKANNDVYIDGVRDPGISVRETFATEQVEIVKGPSGSIAGRGTTGGALNIATKKPQDIDFYEASTEVTSAGTVRQTFDLNFGEDLPLQLRLNGMVQDGEVAGRNGSYDDRRGLAVAARYKVSDSVTIEADYSHVEIEQMPDWGVPYITDGDDTDGIDIPSGPVTELGVDRATFYGIEGRDFQDTTQDVATARLIWDINPNMTLTNTVRASKSVNDYILTAPSSVNDNGSTDPNDWTVNLSTKSRYQETEVFSNTTELTGDAGWFGVKHSYVAGLEFSSEKVRSTSYADLQSEDFPVGSGGCSISVVNPDSSVCWNGNTPVLGTNYTTTDVKTASLYFVDRMELTPQWIVDAGIRVDHYDIDRTGTDNTGAAYALSREDTMLNGNLGVTWKPRADLSLYAAAATSTNPMGSEIGDGGGYYGGLDSNGENLAPERNTSLEVGVKYELNEHLLLTGALFQTTKDHGREDIGPRGATVTQDTLKYRFTGIELGLAGRIGDRVGLYGGAVAMDSEILESGDAANVGSSVANIAHEQFNLLVTYDVTEVFTLGMQANYNGELDLGSTATNGNTLPSSWTFDLVGSYALNDTAAIRFGVKNLTDKTYYDSAYRSGEPFTYVAPGREVWASLDIKF